MAKKILTEEQREEAERILQVKARLYTTAGNTGAVAGMLGMAVVWTVVTILNAVLPPELKWLNFVISIIVGVVNGLITVKVIEWAAAKAIADELLALTDPQDLLEQFKEGD